MFIIGWTILFEISILSNKTIRFIPHRGFQQGHYMIYKKTRHACSRANFRTVILLAVIISVFTTLVQPKQAVQAGTGFVAVTEHSILKNTQKSPLDLQSLLGTTEKDKIVFQQVEACAINSDLVVEMGQDCYLDASQNTYTFNSILVRGKLIIKGYAPVNLGQSSYGVSIVANIIEITETGVISANGEGYAAGYGPGAGGGGWFNCGASGGSYGGYGGKGQCGTPGEPYGKILSPLLLGSGGGNSGAPGGAGGGAIHLIAYDTIRVNGIISANGNNGGGSWGESAGGGSGGSIWIEVNTILGGSTGSIQANGGNGSANQSAWSGGGSGGRIAIEYSQNEFLGSVHATGSGPGTVHWASETQTKLIINNNGKNGSYAALPESEYSFDQIDLRGYGNLVVLGGDSSITLDNNTIIGDGTATLETRGALNVPTGLTVNGYTLSPIGGIPEITDLNITNYGAVDLHPEAGQVPGTFVFDNLTIGTNGKLFLRSFNNQDTNYSNDYGIKIKTNGNLSIAETGIILSDGQGYAAGYGPGSGGGGWFNCGASGGSFGGKGGNGQCGTPGATYGVLTSPLSLGSGGGNSGAPGGAGGGAIHFVVNDTLKVDGIISANGSSGSGGWGQSGGGGSGGSIWIEAGSITGSTTGLIRANGGNGSFNQSAASGGGGGGRIAVYAAPRNLGISYQVEGGSGYSRGEAGTTSLHYSYSSVDLDREIAVANNTDAIQITVTLKDNANQPVTGHSVHLEATGAGNAITVPDPIVTDANGQTRFSLVSSRSGTKILTVVDDTIGAALTVHPLVSFIAGDIHPVNSTITVNPATVPADGVAASVVTVKAADGLGNPISGAAVKLITNGNAVITQPEVTDNQGETIGRVTNRKSETVTVQARVNGVALTGTASIVFTGSDPGVDLSGPHIITPQQDITYSVTVFNRSAVKASGVSLTLVLPPGLTFVSHTASIEPVEFGNMLVWNLGDFAPDANIPFQVTAHTSAALAVGSVVKTAVSVTSLTADQDPSNNIQEATSTVRALYDFTAGFSPQDETLYLGGKVDVNLTINNTGLAGDAYTISVAGVDASWVAIDQAEIALRAGGSGNTKIRFQIGQRQQQNEIPYTINVVSDAGNKTLALHGRLNLSQSPNLILRAPANNTTVGSTSVTFAWDTVPDTTGALRVYPSGQPDQAQIFTTEQGANHYVQVDQLERNTTYQWEVVATSACGVTTSSVPNFTVGYGIVFVNRSQSYDVDRDYDQRVNVSVRNDDSIPHTLTASISNPYEDLIISFVDSGSADQTITLPPGASKALTLAIHAQDAKQQTYPFTVHLVADQDSSKPITDDARLDVRVLAEGDFTIEEDTAAFDLVTLARTFIITNRGKTITDLSLKAVDPVTGAPANIFLQPSLDHARLEKDQSLRVVAYPIFTEADAAAQAATSGRYMASLTLDDTVSAVNFTLQGNAAGNTKTLSGTTACPSGRAIYRVNMSSCTMNFKTSDWYCTNRPTITTPINIPAFLTPQSIASLSLGLVFTPYNNVLPHAGQVRFNGQEIASFSDSIPAGKFSFPVPIQSWNSGIAGLVTQNVEMLTQHNNSGHYISSTGYSLDVAVRDATTYVCADSQTVAQQVVQATYACGASTSFNPWTDVYDGSTLNWGEIKRLIKDIAGDHGYQISTVSCTQGDCGDPINTRTGVFSFASPDLSFPTSAGDLVFQRAYSSGSAAIYADVLGYGWTHNHDARLIFPSDPSGMAGFVIFKDVLGNQYLFGIEENGDFRPGPGVLAALEKSASSPSIYTLTTPEQARLTFDETGKIFLGQMPRDVALCTFTTRKESWRTSAPIKASATWTCPTTNKAGLFLSQTTPGGRCRIHTMRLGIWLPPKICYKGIGITFTMPVIA